MPDWGIRGTMRGPITAVSDRFELIDVPRTKGAPTFAQDVAAGLSASPKRLSSKYLYDDVGSALFDAIMVLPEYYLSRAETEILREWGWQMVRVLDAPIDFLELGSGNAVKTRLLIGEALRVQGRLRYSPIDISTEALRASSMALVDAYPGLTVRAYAGDYFDVLASRALRFDRRVLAMFMGSNIGNYEPDQAVAILSLLRDALRPGDGVLIGMDLKKDPSTIELAYDDPAGVTAAFNRNLLARMNRELGANFEVKNFDYRVQYDEARGAMDAYLVARNAATVRLGKIKLDVAFAAGEPMHTESAYKFGPSDVSTLAASTGFKAASSWTDRAGKFSVNLLVRG